VRIPTLKEQRRNWFLANELRTPGGLIKRKDDLGWAWHWMMNCAPFMKLNSKEENLFNLAIALSKYPTGSPRGCLSKSVEKLLRTLMPIVAMIAPIQISLDKAIRRVGRRRRWLRNGKVGRRRSTRVSRMQSIGWNM
jgi:hypothetical protein